MEVIILLVCAVAAISCLCANLLIAALLWRHLYTAKTALQEPVEETPEEKEARRVAAEAQRLYEQGFVNLMEFDGRPQKKEGEER